MGFLKNGGGDFWKSRFGRLLGVPEKPLALEEKENVWYCQ
jgi:hypothetical protein